LPAANLFDEAAASIAAAFFVAAQSGQVRSFTGKLIRKTWPVDVSLALRFARAGREFRGLEPPKLLLECNTRPQHFVKQAKRLKRRHVLDFFASRQ
jgi:hypothetical protein